MPPAYQTDLQREVTSIEKQIELHALFYEALEPPQYLDLDEWADKYRYLPRETSAEHGLWSTARFPFLRKIMKCLSPSSVAKSIVAMKGAQLGFTEVSINWMLYGAATNPGPTMYAQATDDAAEDFSKQKLAPSIAACPEVEYILGDKKPRALSDTVDDKGYPGGYIALGSANNEKFTRSKSCRDVTADEEDSYVANSDGGGSPLKNLAKRMVTFGDKKFFRLSTPKIKETSTIEPAYEFGSCEQYYVPCPHCNPTGDTSAAAGEAAFVIEWDQIKWSKEIDKKTGLPLDVWLECPHCAESIREDKKTWMLANGEWYSMKGAAERYVVSDDTEYRSFQISSLYSPFGFFSWRDAVEEWFEYKRSNDVNLLQVFINQTLGQSFTLEGQEISGHALRERREEYGAPFTDYDVPRDALVLTAGVDIQKDRIECEVVGWGLHDESWSVDYVVFPGDTAQLGNQHGITADGQPSVWLLLDQYLQKRWRHWCGMEMVVEVTMVDANYRADEAHTFCRYREDRRVFPLRGKDGWGFGLYQVDHKRHKKYGTVPYTAYVDELKSKLYGYLAIEAPGPGYCHYPRRDTYGDKYFRGLTCEVRKTKFVNGKKKLFWFTPPHARNEPVDCRNYAYVGLKAYPVDLEERARHVAEMREGTGATAAAVPAHTGQRRRRGQVSPGITS